MEGTRPEERPKDEGGQQQTGVTTKDVSEAVGPPHSQRMRDLAEDLPEKDEVQVAYKDALTADDAHTEAKAKAKVVEASPNAADTPSGGALLKTKGIADDTKRGEAYAREKAARRHGYADEE